MNWANNITTTCTFTTLAQSCSCIEPSLAFATGTTSKHQRVKWPGLYRKIIEFLRIVVWHMRVYARLLEVTWLECVHIHELVHHVINQSSPRTGNTSPEKHKMAVRRSWPNFGSMRIWKCHTSEKAVVSILSMLVFMPMILLHRYDSPTRI